MIKYNSYRTAFSVMEVLTSIAIVSIILSVSLIYTSRIKDSAEIQSVSNDVRVLNDLSQMVKANNGNIKLPRGVTPDNINIKQALSLLSFKEKKGPGFEVTLDFPSPSPESLLNKSRILYASYPKPTPDPGVADFSDIGKVVAIDESNYGQIIEFNNGVCKAQVLTESEIASDVIRIVAIIVTNPDGTLDLKFVESKVKGSPGLKSGSIVCNDDVTPEESKTGDTTSKDATKLDSDVNQEAVDSSALSPLNPPILSEVATIEGTTTITPYEIPLNNSYEVNYTFEQYLDFDIKLKIDLDPLEVEDPSKLRIVLFVDADKGGRYHSPGAFVKPSIRTQICAQVEPIGELARTRKVSVPACVYYRELDPPVPSENKLLGVKFLPEGDVFDKSSFPTDKLKLKNLNDGVTSIPKDSTQVHYIIKGLHDDWVNYVDGSDIKITPGMIVCAKAVYVGASLLSKKDSDVQCESYNDLDSGSLSVPRFVKATDSDESSGLNFQLALEADPFDVLAYGKINIKYAIWNGSDEWEATFKDDFKDYTPYIPVISEQTVCAYAEVDSNVIDNPSRNKPIRSKIECNRYLGILGPEVIFSELTSNVELPFNLDLSLDIGSSVPLELSGWGIEYAFVDKLGDVATKGFQPYPISGINIVNGKSNVCARSYHKENSYIGKTTCMYYVDYKLSKCSKPVFSSVTHDFDDIPFNLDISIAESDPDICELVYYTRDLRGPDFKDPFSEIFVNSKVPEFEEYTGAISIDKNIQVCAKSINTLNSIESDVECNRYIEIKLDSPSITRNFVQEPNDEVIISSSLNDTNYIRLYYNPNQSPIELKLYNNKITYPSEEPICAFVASLDTMVRSSVVCLDGSFEYMPLVSPIGGPVTLNPIDIKAKKPEGLDSVTGYTIYFKEFTHPDNVEVTDLPEYDLSTFEVFSGQYSLTPVERPNVKTFCTYAQYTKGNATLRTSTNCQTYYIDSIIERTDYLLVYKKGYNGDDKPVDIDQAMPFGAIFDTSKATDYQYIQGISIDDITSKWENPNSWTDYKASNGYFVIQPDKNAFNRAICYKIKGDSIDSAKCMSFSNNYAVPLIDAPVNEEGIIVFNGSDEPKVSFTLGASSIPKNPSDRLYLWSVIDSVDSSNIENEFLNNPIISGYDYPASNNLSFSSSKIKRSNDGDFLCVRMVSSNSIREGGPLECKQIKYDAPFKNDGYSLKFTNAPEGENSPGDPTSGDGHHIVMDWAGEGSSKNRVKRWTPGAFSKVTSRKELPNKGTIDPTVIKWGRDSIPDNGDDKPQQFTRFTVTADKDAGFKVGKFSKIGTATFQNQPLYRKVKDAKRSIELNSFNSVFILNIDGEDNYIPVKFEVTTGLGNGKKDLTKWAKKDYNQNKEDTDRITLVQADEFKQVGDYTIEFAFVNPVNAGVDSVRTKIGKRTAEQMNGVKVPIAYVSGPNGEAGIYNTISCWERVAVTVDVMVKLVKTTTPVEESSSHDLVPEGYTSLIFPTVSKGDKGSELEYIPDQYFLSTGELVSEPLNVDSELSNKTPEAIDVEIKRADVEIKRAALKEAEASGNKKAIKNAKKALKKAEKALKKAEKALEKTKKALEKTKKAKK